MNQWRTLYVAVLMGFGLVVAACGESGEGPIVPPPPAPADYADKHMPSDWWADAAKVEEGRKLFIGETNPDVNCASCHGKDGKPVKAGARDFRNGDVPGSADEVAELAVGDRRMINPECVDADAVDRRFLRIMFVRAHTECAAWDPDHIGVGLTL